MLERFPFNPPLHRPSHFPLYCEEIIKIPIFKWVYEPLLAS